MFFSKFVGIVATFEHEYRKFDKITPELLKLCFPVLHSPFLEKLESWLERLNTPLLASIIKACQSLLLCRPKLV